jgi:hypothetical protein
MEKKRGTTRVPQKEEDPSRTSSSIDTPEVEPLQATLKKAQKDQLESLQETLALTESKLIQSQTDSYLFRVREQAAQLYFRLLCMHIFNE